MSMVRRVWITAVHAVLACAGCGAFAQELPAGRQVDLPGVSLLVRDGGGGGTPLVLLHANTGTSETWAPQFEAFRRAGYRVIAFDRRGWGGSVADPSTGPQPGSIAGDLDALATAMKLPPFDLVGVAGGGFAVLDYLGWHPERVRRAVVGASTGMLSDPEFVAYSKRIDVPALDAGPASDLELSASYRGSDPEGVRTWTRIEAHARRQGAPNQPLHAPNTIAKLEAIATPVLVIAADADLLAPPAMMRLWAAHLRNHDWAQVDGAGHSVAWEQPGVFNDLVLGYLARP